MHTKDVIGWLKRRHKKTTNPKYLNYPSELEKKIKLKRIYDKITEIYQVEINLELLSKIYLHKCFQTKLEDKEVEWFAKVKKHKKTQKASKSSSTFHLYARERVKFSHCFKI